MNKLFKVAIISGCLCLIAICKGENIKIGCSYDVTKTTQLRSGPGEKFHKKINQKASDLLKSIEYLSISTSSTIKVLKLKNGWAEVQITEPEYLSKSHFGWVPASVIKPGKPSKKLGGWTNHTCQVYSEKSLDSQVTGYIVRGASINIADDGSGWSKIITAPIRDMNTKKFIKFTEISKGCYIQTKNFSLSRFTK